MTARVRPATDADYPGFARVAHEVHEHHVALAPHVFRSVAVAVPEDAFARFIGNPRGSIVYVAEEAGEIVGYAMLQLRQDLGDIVVARIYAELDNFGVAETHRRRGVGLALFDACVAWAKEHGATSLELNVWEANPGAIHFYEAMGMHTESRWLALDL